MGQFWFNSKLSGVRKTEYDSKPRNTTVKKWIEDRVKFELAVISHKGLGFTWQFSKIVVRD